MKDFDAGNNSGAQPPIPQAAAGDQAADIVFRCVFVRCLDLLSEKQKEELDLVIGRDQSDIQAIVNFLKDNVSDFEQIVNQEVERLAARLK